MTDARPEGPTRSSPDRQVGVTEPQPAPSRPAGPAPPFQFTLLQLLAVMAWVAFALALTVQGELAGFWLWLTPMSIYAIWRGNRLKMPLWTTLGVFGLFASFALFCLLGIDGARGPSARRASCSNNLHNIALALQQYETNFGCYPPPYIADANGKPMHSWRVLLLPYLDGSAVYRKYNFNEPWDGPNNRQLHDIELKIFQCASQENPRPNTETSYVAVAGPKTVWPGGNSYFRDADIIDGASNTILVVEVANSGIHWMEPRDLHINQMPMAINPSRGQGISSHHKGGANVGFADGSVQFLENKLLPKSLHAALTQGSKDNDRLAPLHDAP